MKGLIGKKVGMTQVYDEQGKIVPVTVIEAGPCVVVDVKTADRDGYSAIQLGFGSRKAKNVTKAVQGHCAKAGLKDVPAFSFSVIGENTNPSYWFLRVLFNADAVTVDKNTICDALDAEGVATNRLYAATPYTSDWYQNSIVFGNSGYPWAAPEYKGDKTKRYSLEDLPNTKKSLADTIIIYPNESWTEDNINETIAAFKKVYEAYKK